MIPPSSVRVCQADSQELLKQMDLVIKQRAKSLVSLGLGPSAIRLCQIGLHCYTVPSSRSGENGAVPRTGPYQALLELTESGELPEVVLTLRGRREVLPSGC